MTEEVKKTIKKTANTAQAARKKTVKTANRVIKKQPRMLVGVLLLTTVVFALLYITADTRGPKVNVPADFSQLEAQKQDDVKQKVLRSLEYIMDVPEEIPFMAVMTNAESLQTQQAFYAGVEDGDVLFIFEQSNRAIIYRPDERRIINAGSLVTE